MKHKIGSINEHQDQIGICEVCGGEYVKAVYNYRHQFYDEGHAPLNCPTCHYPFLIGVELERIIASNVSLIINPPGKIRVNAEDLVGLIEKKLKEIWPK
jgi:hypothetical protein